MNSSDSKRAFTRIVEKLRITSDAQTFRTVRDIDRRRLNNMEASTSASLSSGLVFKASRPTAVSIALQTVILSPTFVANFLGNICVCLAVFRVRSLRQKPSSFILVSLAVSDFSLLSFLVFRLIWLYDLEAASKVCEYFSVLLGTLSYVSIIHICLLSCDRYAAIVYPLRYTAIITRKRVQRALFVAWCAPVMSVVVLHPTYGDTDSSHYRSSVIGCTESPGKPSLMHTIHLSFNVTVFVAIPFVVLVFIYGRIAKISWFQSNRVEPGENLNSEAAELRRKKKKEIKWMRTIAMVIGAFAFCYLPAFICLLITAKLDPSRVPNALRSAVVVMIVINSALNPIIYVFRSNEFKRGIKRIFGFSSVAPSTAGNAISAPTGVTRRDLSMYSLHDDLSSFLSVPVDNATSAEPRRPRLPDLNVAGVETTIA